MSEHSTKEPKGRGTVNIIRIKKRENPFVQIDKGALNDTGLSWRAKGLLAYLLSMPDDWQIYVRELSNHSKDGKYGTGKALNELIDAGYCTRSKEKDKRGKFSGYKYTVFEIKDHEQAENPDFKPYPKNGTSVKEPYPNLPYPKTPYPKTPTSVNRTLPILTSTNIDLKEINLKDIKIEQSFSENTEKDPSRIPFKNPLTGENEEGNTPSDVCLDGLASIADYDMSGNPADIEQDTASAAGEIPPDLKNEPFIKALCKMMFKPGKVDQYREAFIIYVERAFPGQRFDLEYLHKHGKTGFDKNYQEGKEPDRGSVQVEPIAEPVNPEAYSNPAPESKPELDLKEQATAREKAVRGLVNLGYEQGGKIWNTVFPGHLENVLHVMRREKVSA